MKNQNIKITMTACNSAATCGRVPVSKALIFGCLEVGSQGHGGTFFKGSAMSSKKATLHNEIAKCVQFLS